MRSRKGGQFVLETAKRCQCAFDAVGRAPREVDQSAQTKCGAKLMEKKLLQTAHRTKWPHMSRSAEADARSVGDVLSKSASSRPSTELGEWVDSERHVHEEALVGRFVAGTGIAECVLRSNPRSKLTSAPRR